MVSVSSFLNDEKIDQALDQLDDEKTFGIALAELARTFIDRPENHEKIPNSFAGNAVYLQNSLVLRELTLWCTRVLENKANSLTKIANEISSRTDEIVAARISAQPDWTSEWLGVDRLPDQIQEFKCGVDKLAQNPTLRKPTIARDEHLAHLLRGISGARRKLDDKSEDVGYTYNSVIHIVDEAVRLISEAIKIWRFHVHSDESTRRIARSYYEAYWRILPNFSVAEEQIRQQKIADKKIAE